MVVSMSAILILTASTASAALVRPPPSFSRRTAVAAAACVMPLPLLAPAPVLAYQDAAAAMAEQFAAAEAARASRSARTEVARRGFELRLDELTSLPRTAERFVRSSDELSLYLIGEGGLPEGVSVQVVVGRLRAAYNQLPKYRVECERKDRLDECFSHGPAAEAAYAALLRQLRKYAQKGAYAQSGGYELPGTPFSF